MVRRLLASQLARPSGPIGPLMAPILNRGNRGINRLVLDRLALAAGSRVLEVGFGGGSALAGVLAHGGVTAYGIEVSEPMLAAARRRFAGDVAAGRLDVLGASVDALPFADDTLDEVFSVNTIYFWPDAERGLREVRRVLRPGGRLVLATMPAERMRRRAYTQTHFRLFDDDDLLRLLAGAGLVDGAVERVDGSVLSTACAP